MFVIKVNKNERASYIGKVSIFNRTVEYADKVEEASQYKDKKDAESIAVMARCVDNDLAYQIIEV